MRVQNVFNGMSDLQSSGSSVSSSTEQISDPNSQMDGEMKVYQNWKNIR